MPQWLSVAKPQEREWNAYNVSFDFIHKLLEHDAILSVPFKAFPFPRSQPRRNVHHNGENVYQERTREGRFDKTVHMFHDASDERVIFGFDWRCAIDSAFHTGSDRSTEYTIKSKGNLDAFAIIPFYMIFPAQRVRDHVTSENDSFPLLESLILFGSPWPQSFMSSLSKLSPSGAHMAGVSFCSLLAMA